MSNRIGQVPRSIKFNEKSINNFVKASSFLNVNSNLNSTSKQNYHQINNINHNRNYAKTDRNFDQNYKLIGFDFYNKNNLLLKACNVEDVQYVTKNPILFEEELILHNQHPHSNKNIPKSRPLQNEKKIKTMKDFYKPKTPQIQQIQKQNTTKSKQAELNQFIFNYRKKEEDKKNKKLKFIEQIEKKLNNLQRQANGLQDQKIKQFQQINGILKISNDTTQYAKKAEMLGKINTALYEIQNQRKIVEQPKKITEDMELLQINLAIQQHHEYNDALLDQIQRVSRSKSKQRIRGSKNYEKQISPRKQQKYISDHESQPHSILSKTMKKSMQAPPRPASANKKLISTQIGRKKYNK